MNQKVAPSILSADFANLETEITRVTAAGADWIHVDVMDGHFVPNLTIGIPVVESLKRISKIPLDVHLMIDQPERYIEGFVTAGSSYLTIHIESTRQVGSCLQLIRKLGARPGITLRPKTPIESLQPYLEMVDLVLVMTVEPGFGGQSFMLDQVEKINWLKDYRVQHGLNYLIEVDGGISDKTVGWVKNADVLVAGSFIFKNDYATSIRTLKGI